MQPLVDQLLARCAFPPAGQAVDCAVSGGADSSALLILAAAHGCAVTAHHVDHGLRPGSSSEAETVAALATRFDAQFVGHNVVIESGPNLEARARAARYGVLPLAVMTGHTLDDRAETVLINLLRGAARTGLAPMRGRQRHPLIRLRRVETHELCAALGVEVFDDPSNHDPSFVRNRVRHEALPLLAEISGRDLAVVLDRQADVLGAEDDLLDELASAIDPTDAKAVAAAPRPLARRAIRRFIAQSWERGHPPGADSVERVLAVAGGSATACEIEGGHRVYRRDQKLTIAPVSLV